MNGAPDFQTIWNIVMTLGVPVGLYVVKLVFDRIAVAHARADAAHDLIAAHKTHAAETFLTVERFDGFEERLFTEIRAIRDALGDKADR